MQLLDGEIVTRKLPIPNDRDDCGDTDQPQCTMTITSPLLRDPHQKRFCHADCSATTSGLSTRDRVANNVEMAVVSMFV